MFTQPWSLERSGFARPIGGSTLKTPDAVAVWIPGQGYVRLTYDESTGAPNALETMAWPDLRRAAEIMAAATTTTKNEDQK